MAKLGPAFAYLGHFRSSKILADGHNTDRPAFFTHRPLEQNRTGRLSPKHLSDRIQENMDELAEREEGTLPGEQAGLIAEAHEHPVYMESEREER